MTVDTTEIDPAGNESMWFDGKVATDNLEIQTAQFKQHKFKQHKFKQHKFKQHNSNSTSGAPNNREL